LKLVAALPKTLAGRTIGGQLVRSGTSVAANYRAACRARSKAEFISRLGVVEEEGDESALWLGLIMESQLMKKALVETIMDRSRRNRSDNDKFSKVGRAVTASGQIQNPKSKI
jgi:four helix bundle protein